MRNKTIKSSRAYSQTTHTKIMRGLTSNDPENLLVSFLVLGLLKNEKLQTSAPNIVHL